MLAESERGLWLLRGRDMRVVYVGAGACGCCMLLAVCYVCVHGDIIIEVAYSAVCTCGRGDSMRVGLSIQALMHFASRSMRAAE